ncbi:MAG: DUF6328 family protein [Anaeromyxobacteraceae bacterium]
MASLAEKLQDALDEGRILVLGIQVLVGFGYRAVFEEGFSGLPRWAQLAKLGSLSLLLLALALVVLPSAWHRLAERGEDTRRLDALTRVVMSFALLPLAGALGLDVLVAAIPAAGERVAIAAGAAAALAAGVCWYGLEAVARARRKPEREADMTSEQRSREEQVNKKIRHVLTEARTVLPGAQAMLGFQLAATLAKGFAELPRAAKLAHLGAILMSALAIALLVAPAAYHRIVEKGELTDHFHRVASGFVVAACVPVAATLALDLGVVTWKLVESRPAALAAASTALTGFLFAWIALPLAARAARERAVRARPSPRAPSTTGAAARPGGPASR